MEIFFIIGYSITIFRILALFIQNKYVIFFALGFVKHVLSYYLQIKTYYCNDGKRCSKILDQNKEYVAVDTYLLPESLIQGLWYLIASSIIYYIIHVVHMFKFIKNEKVSLGLIVVFVSLMTKFIEKKLHLRYYFCKYDCVEKPKSTNPKIQKRQKIQ